MSEGTVIMRNQEVTLVAIDKENFRNGTSLLDSMIHEKVVGTPGDNSCQNL